MSEHVKNHERKISVLRRVRNCQNLTRILSGSLGLLLGLSLHLPVQSINLVWIFLPGGGTDLDDRRGRAAGV